VTCAVPRIGVVGASARAAVHSLARAGLGAWAVDLFGDRDLRLVAPCAACPASNYPDALPPLARHFHPGPVLVTGGLENHPAVVAQLAGDRELWGSPPAVIERVRDPYALAEFLAAHGFASPRILAPGEPCPAPGEWLLKSRRSSGGFGVRFARASEVGDASHHLQGFIDGPPMSAVFIAGTSHVELFGVTEQLVGVDWLHARGFRYAGNVGPAEITEALRRELTRLGSALAAEFGLRGVFGVDIVLRNGRPWVVEVNPRYPASVEVIEHGTGKAVFGGARMPPGLFAAIGKAIYYAPHRLTFPAAGPWDADLAADFDPWRLPGFADIPEPGTLTDAGSPVLTIFAAASSPALVRGRLQSRAAELDRLLAGTGP
jgi:predicted ATP-grasp superfamily ATP-dependent carboligase